MGTERPASTGAEQPASTGPERHRGPVPRRYLEAYLLLTLRRDGRSYGYELCETVRALGLNVDLAGVYRALRRMDRSELVSAAWVPSDNGPDRREYVLTEIGRAAATEAAGELAGLRDVLTAALTALDVSVAESS